MDQSRTMRPISVPQIVGILTLALIVYFGVAFASKAVDTYRLRLWRNDLEHEIAAMERQRQALLIERERRESLSWIDQALKETGRVPADVLVVRLVSPAVRQAPSIPSVEPVSEAPAISDRIEDLALFDNPNWTAWLQLLLRRP